MMPRYCFIDVKLLLCKIRPVLALPHLPGILAVALKRGGCFAEIFAEKTTHMHIRVADKNVDDAVTGSDQGVGLRVLDQALNTVYGYTNHTRKADLLKLADGVALALNDIPIDRNIELKKQAANLTFPIKKPGAKIPLAEKVSLAKSISDAVWRLSPRIKQVLIDLNDSVREIEIANSENLFISDRKIITSLIATITMEEQENSHTQSDVMSGFAGFELFDAQAAFVFVKNLVRRCERNLLAKEGPHGTMPVVIAGSAGGTLIHEAVGHALEADLIFEGMSFLKGKLGKKVASELITVVDDATLPGKRGSFAFDDEGSLAQRTVLIDRGILKNYLCDRLCAQRLSLKSTGNGRRESYEYRPIPRMTNTLLESGLDHPDDIIKSVKQGLLVTKMGGGQVDTLSGQFVFDAEEAFVIEKGTIGPPIKKVSLTSSAQNVLMNIDRVGTDLGFASGTCGKNDQEVPVTDAIPTIRIKELTVG